MSHDGWIGTTHQVFRSIGSMGIDGDGWSLIKTHPSIEKHVSEPAVMITDVFVSLHIPTFIRTKQTKD